MRTYRWSHENLVRELGNFLRCFVHVQRDKRSLNKYGKALTSFFAKSHSPADLLGMTLGTVNSPARSPHHTAIVRWHSLSIRVHLSTHSY